jgi:hypothetical protein
MNDSAIREGNNPYFAMAASAFLSLVVGFCISKYSADYGAQINSQNVLISAQNAEIRAHDLDIERLKTSVANDEGGISRIESAVSTTQSNVNALVGQFGILKTTLDAQIVGFNALQKQVGDQDRDRWLRPDASSPSASHSR